MCITVFRWTATLVLIILLIPPFTYGQSAVEKRELRTVVIDPGHGGHDPGAVSGGVREKDLVLSISLRLGNKIKNSFPDVKIIYTRSADVFIPLHERAAKAVRNKADIFISVHANYVAESGVRGTETFTLGLHRSQENLEVAKKENSVILLEDDYTGNYQGFDPNETESYIMFENMQSEYQSQSLALAANIQDAFTKNIGLNNRGVKQAGFLVLRKTSMPSVLIEIGFISNPTERKFLSSENGKEQISESIFKAFSTYKKAIDQRSHFELASAGLPSHSVPDTGRQKVPATTDSIKTFINAEKKIALAPDSGRQPSPVSMSVPQKISQTPANKTDTGKNNQIPPEAKNSSGKKPGNTEITANPVKSEVYYSLQISALKIPLDPLPSNFKGEKGIFRVKVEPYFKFYSGKFGSSKEAFIEKRRLNPKFPDAFVVIFENNVPRIFK